VKNRMLAVVVTVVVCAGVFAVLSTLRVADAAAQTPSGAPDVVMLRCATGSDFEVKAYEGSTNAPSKKTNSCPENVSLLIGAGFSIESVGYFDQDDKFIAYTMIRGPR